MIKELSENMFKIYQKDILDDEVDLLEFQRESYSRFKSTTVHELCKYFIETMSNKLEACNIQFISSRVDDEVNTFISYDALSSNTMYFSVFITFSFNGNVFEDIKLLEIPHLDSNGVLRIGKSEKILLNEVVKAKAITYDKNTLQILGTKYSLNFVKQASDIMYKTYKSKLSINLFITYIAYLAGYINEDDDPAGIDYIFENFSNRLMRVYCDTSKKKNEYTMTKIKLAKDLLGNMDFLNVELGVSRDILNDFLSYDKCIGQIVAIDIPGICDKGDIITHKHVRMFYKENIFKVYIKYLPNVSSMILAEDICIDILKEGIKVTPYVLSIFPELLGKGYVDNDINTYIVLKCGETITKDILEFLYAVGIDTLLVSKTKTSDPLTIFFYHEVIWNGQCKADYIEGMSGENYINRDTLEENNKLTYRDIISICNLMCGLSEMPHIFKALRRDIDFVKDLNTIDETFSKYIKLSINNYASTRRAPFTASCENGTVSREIGNIRSSLIKLMVEGKVIPPAEFINPLAPLAQARRISSILKDTHSASLAMRSIFMGHLGRICPYDTPQSHKIGLVNSLAMRVKIKDGKMLSPYHKIVCRGGEYFIDKEIHYLSPEMEYTNFIGDILLLKHKGSGRTFDDPIIKEYTIARVPAPEEYKDDSMIIEMVLTTELTYVNVYADQTLSITASMIPFIGGDDGARVQFGSSMLRQAPMVMQSEIPIVMTKSYSTVVEQAGYTIKSPVNAKVLNCTAIGIKLKDEDGIIHNMDFKQLKIRTNSITVFNPRVSTGDIVKKGQLLADTGISKDGLFSPGVNMLVAYIPFYGYNFEDAIPLARKASQKLTTISVNIRSKTVKNVSTTKVSTRIVADGTYIDENDTIVDIAYNDHKDDLKAKHGQTGVLFNVGVNYSKADDSKTFTGILINFGEEVEGDKLAGRHGNKGVNSVIFNNSEMPMFKNGEIIDVCLNPCGVGSRMNVGQELEVHLGFVGFLLDLKFRSDSYNGASLEDIKDLMKFVHAICNCTDPETEEKKFPNIHINIRKRAVERYDYLKEWAGCFSPDGTAILIDPRTGQEFESPVVIGCAYFLKLSHDVEHKRHERSGLSDAVYGKISKGPTEGSKNEGGQKIGEMERRVLEAHGACAVIEESMNERSTNTYVRDYMEKCNRARGTNEIIQPINREEVSSWTVEHNQILLEALGLDLDLGIGTDLACNSLINRVLSNEKEEDIDVNNIFNIGG